MAFVYRLIRSMREISKQDMLSNLNWEAEEAVLGCEHYTEEYFNIDSKSENYRKTIANVTSNQLLQLQNRLDEVEQDINSVESRIRQLRDGIKIIKEKAIALRSESEQIIKSSSHDPCVKFSECIIIERWKNLLISTVSEKHDEIKNLHNAVRRLARASQKKTKVSEKKREIKFKIPIGV